MRKFRRAFLAPVLATLALVVGAPAASAQEQEFVTFQQAELITPFVVQVSGTAQCEPGDFVDVSVEIRQRPRNAGYGGRSFECTETNETFVVNVVAVDRPFHRGRATLIGRAWRYGPSSAAFDEDIQEIPIRR